MLRTYRTVSWPTRAAATRSTLLNHKLGSSFCASTYRRKRLDCALAPHRMRRKQTGNGSARRMGHPVRYVRNIYKYYVAHKLIEEADAAKKATISAATTQPAPA